MTNSIWTLSPDERLREWRSFRKSINSNSIDEILVAVAEWWKLAPLGTRVIDIYDETHWPDPWELLHKGQFDENAIALGMAYSLHLMEIPTELLLLQNRTDHFLGLIVLIDKKYVLNYTYGIVDKETAIKDCQTVKRWAVKDLIN